MISIDRHSLTPVNMGLISISLYLQNECRYGYSKAMSTVGDFAIQLMVSDYYLDTIVPAAKALSDASKVAEFREVADMVTAEYFYMTSGITREKAMQMVGEWNKKLVHLASMYGAYGGKDELEYS